MLAFYHSVVEIIYPPYWGEKLGAPQENALKNGKLVCSFLFVFAYAIMWRDSYQINIRSLCITNESRVGPGKKHALYERVLRGNEL